MEEHRLKVAGLVEEGIAKGEFKPIDSRLVASLVIGGVSQLARASALLQEPLRPNEIADEITRILCDGISR